MSRLIVPSYHNNFATCAAESEAPWAWKGLVAGYGMFLGPTGLKLRDQSAFKNHGTLVNGPTWVTTVDKFGRSIYALDFDGSDDYAPLDCNPLSSGNQIAWSLWVNLDSVDAVDSICRFQTTNKGYSLWLNDIGAGALNLSIGDGASFHSFLYAHGMSVGKWYHIVAQYDGNKGEIFVNNNSIGSTVDAFTPVFSGITAYEFGNRTAGYGFNGRLSNVYLYNRALIEAEIQQSYFDPYAMWRRRRRVWGFVAPAGGVAPTSVIYGPLVGPTGGPV